MPKAAAVEVEAGGRAVRVSSPDRVIYEATDTTPEVTKLMVAEYFASVEDGLMRALRERPTALERWTSGVRPGMKLATSRMDRDADAFYQKRVPKGAPDYLETVEITFPSGRTADEICPTEIAVPVWCAHMGTLTFHPWPVRRSDVDRPDELRLDLDPQPGTSFTDAVAGGRRRARAAGGARAAWLREDLGQPRHPHLRADRAALGVPRRPARRDRLRPRAGPPRLRVTVDWWKEERGERIFIDFNQNCRDRTIASAYSLRPIVGAPVSTPLTWEELAEVTDPREFNLFTVPERLAASGDAWATIDDTAYSLEPLLALYDELPGGEMPFPPDYPKMPGEPPRVQPSKKVEEHWDADGNWIGPVVRAAPEHGLGGEAAHVAAFLAFYRATVVEKARSLPDAELRRPLVPSGWTPLELVRHLAFMERRWFVWGFLGEQADGPVGRLAGRVATSGVAGAVVGLAGRRGRALLAGQAARTEAVLATTPLEPARRDHRAGSGPTRRTCATSASTCCRSTRATPGTSTSRSSSPGARRGVADNAKGPARRIPTSTWAGTLCEGTRWPVPRRAPLDGVPRHPPWRSSSS